MDVFHLIFIWDAEVKNRGTAQRLIPKIYSKAIMI